MPIPARSPGAAPISLTFAVRLSARVTNFPVIFFITFCLVAHCCSASTLRTFSLFSPRAVTSPPFVLVGPGALPSRGAFRGCSHLPHSCTWFLPDVPVYRLLSLLWVGAHFLLFHNTSMHYFLSPWFPAPLSLFARPLRSRLLSLAFWGAV